MADSKKTSTEEVQAVEEQAVATPVAPANEDKVVGEGENLYFFPDIQKSVVAKSLKDAQEVVQADLDAFEQQQKEEGNK